MFCFGIREALFHNEIQLDYVARRFIHCAVVSQCPRFIGQVCRSVKPPKASRMKKLQSSCTSAFTVFEIDSLLWTYTGSEKKTMTYTFTFSSRWLCPVPSLSRSRQNLTPFTKLFCFFQIPARQCRSGRRSDQVFLITSARQQELDLPWLAEGRQCGRFTI
jgi:hypothetical protein